MKPLPLTAFCLILLIISCNAKDVSRATRINTLINDLNSKYCDVRESANKQLLNMCSKRDIGLLERVWKKSKSAEQRLRLSGVLIKLKWIPPKQRQRLKEYFELIKSPDKNIRQKAVIDILSTVNGKHWLKERLENIRPGKLELMAKINKQTLKHKEAGVINFQLRNIDKHGFFVREARFKKIRLEFSTKTIVDYSPPLLKFMRPGIENEIEDFIYLKPGQALELKQKFTNNEFIGPVKIVGIYSNKTQYFSVSHFTSKFELTYQEYFSIYAWRGKLQSKSKISYYSVLPSKQIEVDRILAEICDKGINFVNYSPGVKHLKLTKFIRIHNGQIEELLRCEIIVSAKGERVLKINHPKTGTFQYQFVLGNMLQGATNILRRHHGTTTEKN